VRCRAAREYSADTVNADVHPNFERVLACARLRSVAAGKTPPSWPAKRRHLGRRQTSPSWPATNVAGPQNRRTLKRSLFGSFPFLLRRVVSVAPAHPPDPGNPGARVEQQESCDCLREFASSVAISRLTHCFPIESGLMPETVAVSRVRPFGPSAETVTRCHPCVGNRSDGVSNALRHLKERTEYGGLATASLFPPVWRPKAKRTRGCRLRAFAGTGRRFPGALRRSAGKKEMRGCQNLPPTS
jgi:hypothetical protein